MRHLKLLLGPFLNQKMPDIFSNSWQSRISVVTIHVHISARSNYTWEVLAGMPLQQKIDAWGSLPTCAMFQAWQAGFTRDRSSVCGLCICVNLNLVGQQWATHCVFGFVTVKEWPLSIYVAINSGKSYCNIAFCQFMKWHLSNDG